MDTPSLGKEKPSRPLSDKKLEKGSSWTASLRIGGNNTLGNQKKNGILGNGSSMLLTKVHPLYLKQSDSGCLCLMFRSNGRTIRNIVSFGIGNGIKKTRRPLIVEIPIIRANLQGSTPKTQDINPTNLNILLFHPLSFNLTHNKSVNSLENTIPVIIGFAVNRLLFPKPGPQEGFFPNKLHPDSRGTHEVG